MLEKSLCFLCGYFTHYTSNCKVDCMVIESDVLVCENYIMSDKAKITDLQSQLAAADDEIVRLREGCIELEKKSVPFEVFKKHCHYFHKTHNVCGKLMSIAKKPPCTKQTCKLVEVK